MGRHAEGPGRRGTGHEADADAGASTPPAAVSASIDDEDAPDLIGALADSSNPPEVTRGTLLRLLGSTVAHRGQVRDGLRHLADVDAASARTIREALATTAADMQAAIDRHDGTARARVDAALDELRRMIESAERSATAALSEAREARTRLQEAIDAERARAIRAEAERDKAAGDARRLELDAASGSWSWGERRIPGAQAVAVAAVVVLAILVLVLAGGRVAGFGVEVGAGAGAGE